ncbi:MAG TPA: ferredoxin [Lentisphaeria bacterium]|nr:MAG: hypothetical protein A2X48_22745 [Lentisphaerae bacterium GWF2_49_21]HBC85711.1 ferredoxin [Lentisphaeria bacterium]
MKKYKVSRGCTHCGTCIFECPKSAISIDDAGAHIDMGKCVGCGICADNCASEAITSVELGDKTENQIKEELR